MEFILLFTYQVIPYCISLLGCHRKYHTMTSINNRNVLSHRSGGQKFKSKMLEGLVLSEDWGKDLFQPSFPSFLMTVFFLFSFTSSPQPPIVSVSRIFPFLQGCQFYWNSLSYRWLSSPYVSSYCFLFIHICLYTFPF